MGQALAGKLPAGERLAFDAAGYLAGMPGDTAALLIAGEVLVAPAASTEGAAEGPPALTIAYLLLDAKKQPVLKGPVPPVEVPPSGAAAGAAGAATRIVFSGAVDGLAPDTYILRVAATDGQGRVGLVEREIALKATGTRTSGATAADVLIGRIERDRSVTLAPGALDVGDTVFLQWEAAAAAIDGRPLSHRARRRRRHPADGAGGNGHVGRRRPRPRDRGGAPGPAPDRRPGDRRRGAARRHRARRSHARLRGPRRGGGGRRHRRRRPPSARSSATSRAWCRPSPATTCWPRRSWRAPSTCCPLARDRTPRGRPSPSARAGQRVAPEASLASADAATAAFLSGLADLAALPGPAADPSARALARADLERAAQRFRDALRADADFLPAAVFLGACYALGGRDQEAAGAWQTALIGIDDDPRLFTLIVDARLRVGDAAGADDVAGEAAKRWPDDAGLRQRRPVVALARGRVAEALTAIDALDEPTPELLFAALRILHGARAAGLAVDDPTRRSSPVRALRRSLRRARRDRDRAGQGLGEHVEIRAKVVGEPGSEIGCCETFHTMHARVRDIVPRVLTACSSVRNSEPRPSGALVVAGVRQGSGTAMSGGTASSRTAVSARDLTDPDL